MSERVVVCGLGHVGYRVARLLAKLGVEVVVVGDDARAAWKRSLAAEGTRLVEGDPRDERLLVEAGATDASALVAAIDADLANLEVALDVRRVRPDLRLVLRVFDRNLARTLEQSLGNTRALGASALAAPVMAFAAIGHSVIAAFTLADRPLLVGSVRVGASSPLVGLDAKELGRQFGVGAIGTVDEISVGDELTLVAERARFLELGEGTPTPTAAEREGAPGLRATLANAWKNAPRPLRTVFLTLLVLNALSVVVFRYGFEPPIGLVEAIYYTVTTVTTVGYGDITPRGSGAFAMLYATLFMLLGSVTMAVLYSFVTSYVVSEQLRKELGRPPLPREPHVIVVGLGNVGYRIVDELLQAGYPVVAVDIDPNGEFVNALRTRCPVVLGDARLRSTLGAAGVARSIAVVAATGDDAANLAVAFKARRLAPDARTVVRVFDADFAQKLEDGELVHKAVSTSRLAAPAFAASALSGDVASAFADELGLTSLRFRPVPAEWVGRSPRELDVEIPLVRRTGELQAWPPDDPLPEGSEVLSAERRAFVTGSASA
jgi:Trk K+ transport system NAD-binding subunit